MIFRERIRATSQCAVWVDGTEYAGRLLAQGQVPWSIPAEYVALRRKEQALLRSDVVGVPLAALASNWVDGHEDLRQAMSARPKPTFALRSLLADEGLRMLAVELIMDLRSSFPREILSLVIPSPRAWAESAYALAHRAPIATTVDDEQAESASAYVADFLRLFAVSSVDTLLLEEAPSARPWPLGDASYTAISNLCSHYRWDLGVHSATGTSTEAVPGVSFVIAPAPQAYPSAGWAVPQEFWNATGAAPDAADFWFARIPVDAEPERVLERLAVLRSSARRIN